MIDLKLTSSGDLELNELGDISQTDSIAQAVRVRLLWFYREWRLGPEMGFPYFEQLFVKNPNEMKLKHLIRETVMSVEGVRDVTEITFAIDRKERHATITVVFTTDEGSFREEVNI